MLKTKLATLLAAAAFATGAFVSTAGAVQFTLSDTFGTGMFGTITATDLGPQQNSTDTVRIDINMSPNFVVDSGSHYAVVLSLLGTGRIDPNSLSNPPFSVETHLTGTINKDNGYKNASFGFFSDAISGTCTSGGHPCSDMLSFLITNFQGLAPATGQFNGNTIWAAVDITQVINGVNTGNTGVVGAAGNFTPISVPGPIVGAGLPGLIVAALGMLGLSCRRRRD